MLMLDRDIIQGRGFRNVVDGDRITGFQFQLRNPNYRGTSASLLDGIDVTIDGEKIPDHLPVWTLQGRTFSLDELRASTDARWQLDETATITVPKPGGLSVGVHDIDVVVTSDAPISRRWCPGRRSRRRPSGSSSPRYRAADCATPCRPTAIPATSTPR